jgi:hypothetical protein
MSFFSLFLFTFSSTKSENRKEEQVMLGGETGSSERGAVAEKGGGRVNAAQKLCIHVNKCKNDTH